VTLLHFCRGITNESKFHVKQPDLGRARPFCLFHVKQSSSPVLTQLFEVRFSLRLLLKVWNAFHLKRPFRSQMLFARFPHVITPAPRFT
jgi:hypothetical protein